MTLPHFLIIGAQKAGTTWLAGQLQQHHQIHFPTPFEVHFFDVQGNYEKGIDWYETQFNHAQRDHICGEKTPDYFWTHRNSDFHTSMPSRIFECLPNTKVIVMLRDPVTRTISAINHQVSMGRLSPLVDVEKLLFGQDREKAGIFGLLERGHYSDELRSYLALFDEDQIKVLIFEEDVIDEPRRALMEICRFLSVESDFEPKRVDKPVNTRMRSRTGAVLNYYLPLLGPLIAGLDRILPASNPVSISASVEDHLREYFHLRNRDLESLLGRSIERW